MLDAKQMYESQKQIFDLIKSQQEALEKIRNSDTSLINRWQNLLEVVLPAQVEVIKSLGFSEDQSGLSNYNEQFMKRAVEDQALRDLNEEKWSFLLEIAFGVKQQRKISLQDAQNLIEEIATAMTSEEFLQEVDQVVEKIDQKAPMVVKRQTILAVLQPLHLSIMAKHGFEGEEGYVQAQRALVDYYYDPVVMERANHAQDVFLKRANLVK